MIEPMLQTTAQWLDATGPNADIVLYTQCRLIRNLADYPFPKQCKPDEKKNIEENILTVLKNQNYLNNGTYYTLPDIDQTEAQILNERQLISKQLIHSIGPRGVYVRDDQSFSLSINDSDHITMRSLASGQQLQEIWNNTSLTDDTLAATFDYAFHDQRGYLCSNLADTGCGLTFSAILHLPAMTMTNLMTQITTLAGNYLENAQITPLFPKNAAASGDLYQLTGTGMLGQSEMELLYHFTQNIDAFLTTEQETRKQIFDADSIELEDRTERALALARNARLLEFHEALEVLSSLRLGVSTGLLKGYTLSTLNEITIIAQDAHFQLNYIENTQQNTTNAQRAQLFHERFADNT